MALHYRFKEHLISGLLVLLLSRFKRWEMCAIVDVRSGKKSTLSHDRRGKCLLLTDSTRSLYGFGPVLFRGNIFLAKDWAKQEQERFIQEHLEAVLDRSKGPDEVELLTRKDVFRIRVERGWLLSRFLIFKGSEWIGEAVNDPRYLKLNGYALRVQLSEAVDPLPLLWAFHGALHHFPHSYSRPSPPPAPQYLAVIHSERLSTF